MWGGKGYGKGYGYGGKGYDMMWNPMMNPMMMQTLSLNQETDSQSWKKAIAKAMKCGCPTSFEDLV